MATKISKFQDIPSIDGSEFLPIVGKNEGEYYNYKTTLSELSSYVVSQYSELFNAKTATLESVKDFHKATQGEVTNKIHLGDYINSYGLVNNGLAIAANVAEVISDNEETIAATLYDFKQKLDIYVGLLKDFLKLNIDDDEVINIDKINEAYSKYNEFVTKYEDAALDFISKYDTSSENYNSLNTQVETNTGNITTNTNNISDLTSRVSELENVDTSTLTTITNNYNNLNSSIEALKNLVDTQQISINTHITNYSNLLKIVNKNTDDISNLTTNLTEQKTLCSDLLTRLIEDEQTTAKALFELHKRIEEFISSDIDLTTLDARITYNSTYISDLTTKLNNIVIGTSDDTQNALTTLTSNVKALDTRLSSVEQTLENVSEVSINKVSYTYISADNNVIKLKVTSIDTYVGLTYNTETNKLETKTLQTSSFSGLASAYNVSYVLIRDENIIATYLNNYNTRLYNLENNTKDIQSTLTINDNSTSYIAINDDKIEIKTSDISNLVGISYVEGEGWKTKTDEITNTLSLITAYSVASEILNDEKVISNALNNYETRILDLENQNYKSTIDLSYNSSYINLSLEINEDENGKLTNDNSYINAYMTIGQIDDNLSISSAGLLNTNAIEMLKKYIDTQISNAGESGSSYTGDISSESLWEFHISSD